jgi:hypothetical protein
LLAALRKALAGLALKALKERVREDKAIALSWGPSFDVLDYEVEIGNRA